MHPASSPLVFALFCEHTWLHFSNLQLLISPDYTVFSGRVEETFSGVLNANESAQ